MIARIRFPGERFLPSASLSVAAGVLLGFGHLPYVSTVGLVGLVPLFFLWLRVPNPLAALAWTTLTQIVRTMIAGFWVPTGLQSIADFSPFSSWVLFLTLSLFNHATLQLAALSVVSLKRLFRLRTGPVLALSVLTIVVGEHLVPSLIPMPLAHTILMSDLPLAQTLDLAGAWVPLFILATTCALIVYARSVASRPAFLAAVSVFAFGNAVGAFELYRVSRLPDGTNVSLVLVQPSIPNHIKRESLVPEASRFMMGRLIHLTESALPREAGISPTLVIWPETAVPDYLDPRYSGGRIPVSIRKMLARHGSETKLLTGAYSRDPGMKQKYNSAFLLDANGGSQATRKSILFPFGETIPAARALPFLKTWFNGLDHIRAGQRPRLLEWSTNQSTVQLGVALCFEILFDSHIRTLANDGADVFVQLSNEAWFESSVPASQILAMARYRAIQYRKPVIRVDNRSYSGVIAPTGRLTHLGPARSSAILRADLRLQLAEQRKVIAEH